MARAAADDQKPLKQSSSYVWLPPYMSELRVVLLGNSWSQRSSVGNFILGETKFNTEEEPGGCLSVTSWIKEKKITLINTPDLLHPDISPHELTQHVEKCVSLSAPGPHVFLLVLQPEDFTEKHKQKLCRVLQNFSNRSFDHSLVLISTLRQERSGYMEHPPLKDMIKMCKYRHLEQKNLERSELLTRLGQTTKENNGEHVCRESEDEDAGLFMMPKFESDHMKPVLNLVLCGRRGAGKTSAAEAILGQTELQSVSNSSECVQNQREVCGRRVSLVELPALYGKPQQEVMEESFRCISLCDPEGVHAFILVLPVGALTDEDKRELKTIQDTFSSRVNDFTMILFTVVSDPSAPAVENFVKDNKEIQELHQSCGGGCVVVNIKDQQQIPKLLEAVEKMRDEESRCFTKEMFTKAQMKKVSKLRAELHDGKQRTDEEGPSRETLRMVLIGKAGSGKASTGNTILGKKHFKPRITPKPEVKFCEKATGEFEGGPVAVVNTPALFGTTLSDDELQREIKKCNSLLAPGPHVFLLILQIGNFTQEEKDSVEMIKKYFGKKSEDFIIIIFTRGDEMEDESFENYIEHCDDFVRSLVKDCGGRYQVFNNKDETNRSQVRELLMKIETMVKENNGCYNTEMLDNTEKVIQVQVEKALKEKEEEMKKKEERLKRKHEEDLQTLHRKLNEQRGEIEQERKLRAKQLMDKDECIKKERQERKREREEEERRWRKQQEIQRQDWKRKLEASEKMIQSEKTQRENSERKLELYRKEMRRDRDAWDKERKDVWERIHQEDKQRLEEEKTSLRKLQHEYHRKRRIWTMSVFVLLLSLVCLLWYVFYS